MFASTKEQYELRSNAIQTVLSSLLMLDIVNVEWAQKIVPWEFHDDL